MTEAAVEQSIRERQGNTFLGKRTAKGYVIREVEKGAPKNQWFIFYQGGDRLGAPKRMLPDGGFEMVSNQTEVETVMFFARRAIAQLGD